MKIFIIGLQKTGLTSMCQALEILGFSTIQYLKKEKHLPIKEVFQYLINNNYDLPIIKENDAIADLPVPAFYPQFDACFPNSKFILTIRNKKKWLESIKNHFEWQKKSFTYFKNKPLTNNAKKNSKEYYEMYYSNFVDLCVYGSLFFHENRFSIVYDMHLHLAKEYFKDRPQDLLTIDIEKGEGWEKLCPFLNKPIIEEKFPWLNKSQKKSDLNLIKIFF